MNKNDLRLIRECIQIAWQARENGNHPFGALLADASGEVLLRAENSVVTNGDITAHAELNLVREASSSYPPEYLEECTLYTSTEPCPMCSGAIFWSNIRRVVYGLSEESLYRMIGEDSEEVLKLNCRDVFNQGKKDIQVIGPLLEDEAREPHLGFW
jgi:tRNA(Arg) A34 adenosine deaminase TadA